jgi:drug/metabolite transporter (DMT)-like permease
VPLLLLLTVGIVHTGIAYSFSLDSMAQLSAQTVGIFSYLDPVVAVLLSALLLREPMTLTGIIGSVLILGSALYSEMPERKCE